MSEISADGNITRENLVHFMEKFGNKSGKSVTNNRRNL